MAAARMCRSGARRGELNGEVGVALVYDAEAGRWAVRLRSDETKHVRPAQLRPPARRRRPSLGAQPHPAFARSVWGGADGGKRRRRGVFAHDEEDEDVDEGDAAPTPMAMATPTPAATTAADEDDAPQTPLTSRDGYAPAEGDGGATPDTAGRPPRRGRGRGACSSFGAARAGRARSCRRDRARPLEPVPRGRGSCQHESGGATQALARRATTGRRWRPDVDGRLVFAPVTEMTEDFMRTAEQEMVALRAQRDGRRQRWRRRVPGVQPPVSSVPDQ